jgi:hypothetical protein
MSEELLSYWFVVQPPEQSPGPDSLNLQVDLFSIENEDEGATPPPAAAAFADAVPLQNPVWPNSSMIGGLLLATPVCRLQTQEVHKSFTIGRTGGPG